MLRVSSSWADSAGAYAPKKLWLILLIIVELIAVAGCTDRTQAAHPSPTDKVILANPTDLSKIAGITKFRSCFGHEFGFTSAFEGKEARSCLKHYFVPKDSYTGTDDAVPAYALFDGVIIHVEPSQLLVEQRPFGGWTFDFNHIAIRQGLAEGSEVKAGELIGYVNLKEAHTFDISLQAFNASSDATGKRRYDWYNRQESIFSHMSDEVYAEYAARGATIESMIIPKAVRDRDPCPCDATQPAYPDSPYCPFPPIPFDQAGNGISFVE